MRNVLSGKSATNGPVWCADMRVVWVLFMRSVLIEDDLDDREDWEEHGVPLIAKMKEISGAEGVTADQLGASQVSRFVLSLGALAKSVTPKDRIVCGDDTYLIVSRRIMGRGRAVEFMTTRKDDT